MSERTKPTSSDEPRADRPRAGSRLAARIPRLVERWRAERGAGHYPESPRGLSRQEIELAGRALLALQRGLTGSRALAGRGYMDDGELLGAYLLYYWPVSYMQASLALAECPCSPRRLLDLGSGPGPVSAAVMDGLERGRSLDDLVLVDASTKALDLAVSLLGRRSYDPTRITTMELDLESGAELPLGPFDLITIGHCLNELWIEEPDALERRAELLERAAARLAPGGRILVMEPALLATSRGLMALRDRLASRSWLVLGPCPGSYPCPALAAGSDRSCHVESPWNPPEPIASLANSAGLDRNSVKFAFFFLSPPPTAEFGPREGFRVVSEPMLNKAGRLRYILCGSGELTAFSARAADAEAKAKGFMGLRRGDILVPGGFERRQGGGYGFVPGSTLGIRARAPEAGA